MCLVQCLEYSIFTVLSVLYLVNSIYMVLGHCSKYFVNSFNPCNNPLK